MDNKRAIKFVLDSIGDIDESIGKFIERNFDSYLYKFNVNWGDQTIILTFGKDVMDDLESAFENARSSTYSDLTNYVRFQIYIRMGEKGLIPNFDIVTAILNTRLDWRQLGDIRSSFDERTTSTIVKGLKRLSLFLDEIIKKYKTPDGQLAKDKEAIDSYIDFYNKEGHLSSSGVRPKTLSFLKAAVLAEIIELQTEKAEISIPRVIKEKDEQLYALVGILENEPFYKIQLPECAREFAQFKRTTSIDARSKNLMRSSNIMVNNEQKTKIFLSHSHKDKTFVEQLAKDLMRAEIDVWYADWELEFGHSLTLMIQKGIESSQLLAIVLSPEAIASAWVEKEWTAAFKKELESREVVILPILYQDCKIPLLLQDKKYADFRKPDDYKAKSEELIRQLKGRSIKATMKAELHEIYPHVVRATFQEPMQIRRGNELEIHRWLGSPQGEQSLRIGKMKDLTDEIEYQHSFGMMTIVPVDLIFRGRVRGNIVKHGSTTEFDLEMTDAEYQKYVPHKEAKRNPLVR